MGDELDRDVPDDNSISRERVSPGQHVGPGGRVIADDPLLVEELGAWIEQHIGPIASVFHETVSEAVHVDVYAVAPRAGREFWTLVTGGMSSRAMNVPDDGWAPAFAELVMFLPPDWLVNKEAFGDERNFWPIRWLKLLARFPHQHQTWLGFGHTIPNGDPPQPFAPGVGFCCMLLLSPLHTPEAFSPLRLSDGREVAFYALQPLYEAEMEFKLANGTDALLDRFDERGVDDIVDVGRADVCLDE